ncbi:MAG: GNAT family N-acetyltransferase [Chloroflexi bacterium]|nr:GNAT family N-acetyltransferase [Chloroflexota bacterium]
MPPWNIRLIETPEEMTAVEALQRLVWPGSETDVVPAHLLVTAVHNGGLVLGAFDGEQLIGFLFGFPGIEIVPDGPRPKHCSHMLGVHPDHRSAGIGFALKRAQWQMVRQQGLDHVTWTYDPLLSRNAYLNITRLGAVCNTYHRSEYGQMRDGLNAGLPSDRFQVDWWINTKRVERRLSRRSRTTLDLDHFEQAGTQRLYTLASSPDPSLARPPKGFSPPSDRLALIEIPSDFQALKAADFELALDWRFFSREVFETVFAAGYLVTDFVYDRSGDTPHSLYVLAHGESILS